VRFIATGRSDDDIFCTWEVNSREVMLLKGS
jgi:hypothetical protein